MGPGVTRAGAALSAGPTPRCPHGDRGAGGARLSRAGTRGDTARQSHWNGTRTARATGEQRGTRPGRDSRETAGDKDCEIQRSPGGDKVSRSAGAAGPPAGKAGCGTAGRVPLSPGSHRIPRVPHLPAQVCADTPLQRSGARSPSGPAGFRVKTLPVD